MTIELAKQSKAYAAGILGTSKTYKIDPDVIDIREGHNARFDFGDIEELASMIKAQWLTDKVGVREPLKLQRRKDNPERFWLVSGERRLTAVRLLQKKGITFPEGIPAKLLDGSLTESQLKLEDFKSNIGGKPLTPIEEARFFLWLKKENNLTDKQIAESTGRWPYHVSASLQMLTADGEVLKAVEEGVIGVTMAKDLSVHLKGDVEAQRAAVKEMRDVKGNKQATRATAKKLKQKVRETQEAKAAARGKELKMRTLTDDQLKELGAKVAKDLDVLLKDIGLSAFSDPGAALLSECAADSRMAAAFTIGALQALKAAAGVKIVLKM